LKSLKNQKFITIDIANNLEKEKRKIWPSIDFKKMFTERQKCRGGATKMSSNTLSINNTTNKDSPIIPEGDSISLPKKPKKRVKKMEDDVQRNSGVSTTPSQHEYLLEKANGDEDLVSCWYDKLRTWKLEKSITGGNDFKAINNWVISAVEKGAGREQRSKQNNIYAKQIFDAYPEMQHTGELELTENSLKFKRKVGQEYIKTEINFGENGFLEQCRTALLKHNAPMDRLVCLKSDIK
jgi:hypothetical protein